MEGVGAELRGAEVGGAGHVAGVDEVLEEGETSRLEMVLVLVGAMREKTCWPVWLFWPV